MLKQIESGLIPIYESEKGSRLVNARELHEFLESKQEFATWIKARLCEADAVESVDYTTFDNFIKREDSNLGTKKTEYLLKLNIAKEMSMLERNDKGKQIRRYFIQIEDKFKQQLQPSSIEDLIIMQAQSMKELRGEVRQLQVTTQTIKETFTVEVENWRDWVNSSLNKIVKQTNISYQDIRNESYKQLEEKGHCNLAERVRRAKERMEHGGSRKTEINNYCKLSAVEDEPRLKEIYTSIIQKMLLKYAA